MRAALLAFLAAAGLVSATASRCANDNLEDLVSKTSCGCPKKLSKCLETVGCARLDQIEHCFVTSGCEEADATGGAAWLARECQSKDSEARGELRKRKIIADFTTAENTGTGKASTASPTTSDAAPAFARAASETTASSLQCSVTKMVTASVCSSTQGGSKTCTPTVTPTTTCAPGVICQTDSAGNDVCLQRINKLTTSGTVVSIVFVVGIIASAIGIIIEQYKSRRAVRQREKERMALLGGGSLPRKGKGRAPDIEATQEHGQSNPSDAHIPLMEMGGARSDQHNGDPALALPK